ncbi:stage III sporulation protein AG [Bacillus sp. RG28]|uniref:Stage III sporulation protein AG n=1 Tax=Gottfriedia endophytica TaxID=2820819 RepID=A0A940SHX8_9BACI|nr:stage III sporulation protein AG [Gottfriedia endophytica]MBP0724415.1 stage III sporulation protein AG [Gottfriedia endophytica]
MKNKKGYQKLTQFLKGDSDPENQPKQNLPIKLSKKYVLALLVLGIGWMVAGNLFSNSNQKTNDMLQPVAKETTANVTQQEQSVEAFNQNKKSSNNIIEYEKKYEQQLKDTLGNIAGVKDVTVVVNVDSTEKKVYQVNETNRTQTTEEIDKQGGKRNIEDQSQEQSLVIVNDGSKGSPVLVQTEMPKIRGVLVVAKGAENLVIKHMIREAVTRLLDVPSYRVSVQPKN